MPKPSDGGSYMEGRSLVQSLVHEGQQIGVYKKKAHPIRRGFGCACLETVVGQR